MLTVDPQDMPYSIYNAGKFKVEAWVEDNGDGTYKVEYRIWALTKNIDGAKVKLVCPENPEYAAGLELLTHVGTLKPVNYWANYWTPVPEGAFPCQVQFIIWMKEFGG